jgi:phosphatidylinositol alpha-1,6-mannosyltransferase
MNDLYGPGCRLIELASAPGREADRDARALFAARVALAQVKGCDWLLFDHLGVARVQALLLGAVRRPYAVFLHGIEAWHRLSPQRLCLLQRARVRIANSQFTAERVCQANPELGPVQVCPLALTPTLCRGIPDAALLKRIANTSVLIVGRMARAERYKGHDMLIRTWPLVRWQVPNAQLVIAGEGDDRRRLQDDATRMGLSDGVLFTGQVDEATLNALYDRCAVFAMPSRAEGFGLVFLEAMRHGLPCIGSRADATRDVVLDGNTGFLVEPGDKDALASLIIALLENPALRSQLGERGRRRVEQVFSYDRFKAALASALQPLAAGRVGSSGLRHSFSITS